MKDCQVNEANQCVLCCTSQISEGWKKLAGNNLHLIVSQSDNTNVFGDTPQDLENAIWERNELAVWKICGEEKDN